MKARSSPHRSNWMARSLHRARRLFTPCCGAGASHRGAAHRGCRRPRAAGRFTAYRRNRKCRPNHGRRPDDHGRHQRRRQLRTGLDPRPGDGAHGETPGSHCRLSASAVTRSSPNERDQCRERHGGARCHRLGIVLVLALVRSPSHEPAATRIHSVGIQSFEVMRAERIWSAFGMRSWRSGTLALLALVLVYVGFVLAQFPRTRGLSHGMLAFALGPLEVIGNGLIANIPSLVFLIVLFFVVRFSLQADPALLRRHRPRHRDVRELRSGMGAADLQDRRAWRRSPSPSSSPIPTFPGRSPPRSKASRCSSASCSRSAPPRRSPTSSPAT